MTNPATPSALGSRRGFLAASAIGLTAIAASGLQAQPTSPPKSTASTAPAANVAKKTGPRFRPRDKNALGGVGLGNGFNTVTPETQAQATLQ
ncbi:MAG TPA: hypothetical protein VGF99_21145, partial [Myxococcota bacterium]